MTIARADLPALLADVAPPLPEDASLGIGIVGAGTIVRYAHLPAYRKAGFVVVGVHDADPARAHALAADAGLPHSYAELDEMLADPRVSIVDIAVPPSHQPEVALRAACAGKHLLCHKPLAETIEVARELVAGVRQAGVKMAVNQQTRFAPAIVTMRRALAEGIVGEPTRLVFDFAFLEGSDWWDAAPEPALRADCIHTVDVARMLLGDPIDVRALAWRDAKQPARGETIVEILLSYGEQRAARISSNTVWWPPEVRARVELQGTEAIVQASLAEWTHYPHPVADSLELVLRDEPEVRYVPRYEHSHIPDAFIATMAQLMIAVERDEDPELSGEENLRTLELIEAISTAARTGTARRSAGVAP